MKIRFKKYVDGHRDCWITPDERNISPDNMIKIMERFKEIFPSIGYRMSISNSISDLEFYFHDQEDEDHFILYSSNGIEV